MDATPQEPSFRGIAICRRPNRGSRAKRRQSSHEPDPPALRASFFFKPSGVMAAKTRSPHLTEAYRLDHGEAASDADETNHFAAARSMQTGYLQPVRTFQIWEMRSKNPDLSDGDLHFPDEAHSPS